MGEVTHFQSNKIVNDKTTLPPEPPMELIQRVEKLESTVNDIRIDTAVIKSIYSTRADVLESKNSLILWFVSAIAACFLTLAGMMAQGFHWFK